MRLYARARGLVLCAFVALAACDGDEASGPTSDAGAPDAESQPTCAVGEVALPGGICIPPGVPADGCADGFQHDGDAGCVAVLPAERCGHGEMAVPGDSECRPVGSCPPGTWGDVETDAKTQHVDASYVGTSAGSAAQPWTSIQQAIDAASNGALVVVAEGTYTEDIAIEGKSVRLEGRCPGLVQITGTVAALQAIEFGAGADGTTVGGVAVTGPSDGIHVRDAADVVVDGVWLHDLGDAGIAVRSGAAATVSRSLIEGATGDGVVVASGSSATIEASVVRGTRPLQSTAAGVFVTSGGTRSTIAVRGSVIEGTEGAGVFVVASDATVEASVVRETFHEEFGWGIGVQDDDSGRRASLELVTSVIERNQDVAIFAGGSDLVVDRSVVRDTRPRTSDHEGGSGITLQPSAATGAPSTLLLGSSLIRANHAVGCYLHGATGTIERTLIRDILPQEADGEFGRGINASDALDTGAPSSLTLRDSVVVRSHEIAVAIDASEAQIDNVAIYDTRPRASDGGMGRGVQIQGPAGAPSRVKLSRSHIEGSREAGIAIVNAELDVDATVVKATLPNTSGSFGDGIAALYETAPSYVTISGCRVEGSARAGVTSFGAQMAISGTTLECNPVHLDGELGWASAPFVFEDGGGNSCGCGEAVENCTVQTTSLAPPGPLAPSQD